MTGLFVCVKSVLFIARLKSIICCQAIEPICLLAQSGYACLPQQTNPSNKTRGNKRTLGNFQPDFVNKTGDFSGGFYIKGETHAATLYLETFHYRKTVENIIKYFYGERENQIGTQKQKQMKIAYVAMTRPRKLLCVTMEDKVFKKNLDKLEKYGWKKYEDIINE
jgi:hypothetical protein